MKKVFSTSILAILFVLGIATSCKESALQPQSEQPVVNLQSQNDLMETAAATSSPNARAAALSPVLLYSTSPAINTYTASTAFGATLPLSCGIFSPGLRARIISLDKNNAVAEIVKNDGTAFSVGTAYIKKDNLCGEVLGTGQVNSSNQKSVFVSFPVTHTSGEVSFQPSFTVSVGTQRLYSNKFIFRALTEKLPTIPFQGMSGKDSDFGTSKNGGTHTGIDHSGAVGTEIQSVGKGRVHSYTGAYSDGFGALNPRKNGPVIFIEYRTSANEPIYVIYGHISTTYKDTYPTLTYTQSLSGGTWVSDGQVIGKIAPFYNSGISQPHLHMGVFKPKKKADGKYYGLPSSGWGYGTLSRTEGDFLNPNTFLTSTKLKTNW